MLYVSVGDSVTADDLISAGSDSSALLPSELAQHLDTYDGSLGCLSFSVLCSIRVSNTPGNPGNLLEIYKVSWKFSGLVCEFVHWSLILVTILVF